MRLKIFLISLIFFFSVPCYGAVDFNGDSDYINCGSGPTIDNLHLGNMTVSLWVQLDVTTGDYIVGQLNSYKGWVLYSRLTNAIAFWVSDSVAGITYARKTSNNNVLLSDGTWQHIAVTYDSNPADMTTGCHIYIDGSEVGYQSIESGNYEASVSGYNVFVGARSGDGASASNGRFNEVALWNTQLSETAILMLSSSSLKYLPLQIYSDNLVGYWPLDDHTAGTGINGKTYRDLSGNGNNGTGVDTDGDSLNQAESVLSRP